MLRIFNNFTQIIFECNLNVEIDQNFNFALEDLNNVCAFPKTAEDVHWLICFLNKNVTITRIKIEKCLPDFIYIDLSKCTAICDLTLLGFLKCTAVPSNVKKIETETFNLVSPFTFPPSTTSFCNADSCSMYSHISEMNNIEVLIEKNPHLERIIYNRYGEKKQGDLFTAISKRSTPLKFLSVINQIDNEEDLKIAMTNVICLQAYISFSMYKVQYDGPMALKKFISTGKVFFKNMIGWTQRLHEFHYQQSCSDGHEYDGFETFLSTHARLKKIRFGYITLFHCYKIVEFANLFPPNLMGEFLCWSKSHLRDVKKHCAFFLPQNVIFWQPDCTEEAHVIRLCKRTTWLPRLHTNFPPHAQKALYNLALGLTKLKKEKKIVHVDPACIEWILENFSNDLLVFRGI